MKKTLLFVFLLLFLILNCYPKADITNDMSPLGYWKTVDDKTKKVKSLVKIWQENGKLKGRVEEVYPQPGEDPDPICDKCPGEFKDKRVVGLEFMWGFFEEDGNWIKGKILDPENGKVYNCQLEVTDNGQKLDVFGYIKVIFKIGRTQTWLRHHPLKTE